MATFLGMEESIVFVIKSPRVSEKQGHVRASVLKLQTIFRPSVKLEIFRRIITEIPTLSRGLFIPTIHIRAKDSHRPKTTIAGILKYSVRSIRSVLPLAILDACIARRTKEKKSIGCLVRCVFHFLSIFISR